MTCIIGLADGEKVYIGGDSSSTSSWEVRVTRLPKVFLLNGFAIGYTTSFRMGQLIQHRLDVPPQKDQPDSAYMVNVFIEGLRACLKDYGFAQVENNQEKGGVLLVGYRNHLYSIHEDYQVNEMADGVDACGSGKEYALGAMKVLGHLPPQERIVESLKATAYYSGAVLPPFHVVSI